MTKLVDIKSASKWASDYLDKNVKPTNISYLLQYGRIKQYKKNDSKYIDLNELKEYYQNNHKTMEKSWKKELGVWIKWPVSFN
ncbi:MAG: hypothetical protein K9M80_05855 [Candidatus Marinimicrobia bacterium]|nr:hypothetical protein [Candidatus Neomarinimicrobiota bacterium]